MFVLRKILAIAALCVGVIVVADDGLIPLQGRSLVEVLSDYEAVGYTFIYSTDLVGRRTRLRHEPAEGDLVSRLAESLGREGLALEAGYSEGTFRLVRRRSQTSSSAPADLRVLSGRVTDAATGRPLAGVRIEIGGTDTVTAADGRFRVEAAGLGGLSVSHSGYEPKTLSLGRDEASAIRELAVVLEPRIAEIVVATSRYNLAKRARVSRHVLDGTALDAVPTIGDDALRVVNRLPGAGTIGVSAMPNVRGGLRDETLFLFNGVELLEPFHLKDFQGVFSGLDPRILESIEVYTGGYPARYGNRMSAVVDMQPVVPPPRRSVALSLSPFTVGAMAHGPVAEGRGDWSLSARRGTLDFITRRLSPNTGTPSYADAFGRLAWELDSRNDVNAGLILYDDDVEFLDMDDGFGERADSRYRNAYGWVQLHQEWASGLAGATTLSFGRIRHHRGGVARNDDLHEANGVVDDRRGFRIINVVHRTSIARGSWSGEFGGGAELASGSYTYRASGRRGVLAGLLGTPTHIERHVTARPRGLGAHAYASARVRPWRPVMIEAGLRLDSRDYADRRVQLVDPRLSVRFDIDSAIVVRLAAGVFSQPPGIHELQVEDGLARYPVSQRAHHFIASFTREFPSAAVEVHAEAYYKRFTRVKRRFENMFNPFVLLPELAADRVELHPSEAQARGVEASVRYRPGHALEAWLTFSRSAADDRVDGVWRPRRWNQLHSASAGAVWNRSAWSASVALLWHTGWQTTRLPGIVAVDLERLSWNDERLPAFASLDARVSRTWEWSSHSLTLFAEGSNVLDRLNVGAVDYELARVQGSNVFAVSREHVATFPLVPSIGLVWEFH